MLMIAEGTLNAVFFLNFFSYKTQYVERIRCSGVTIKLCDTDEYFMGEAGNDTVFLNTPNNNFLIP